MFSPSSSAPIHFRAEGPVDAATMREHREAESVELVRLGVRGDVGAGQATVAALRGLPRLRRLRIVGSNGIDLAPLAGLQGLEELTLVDCRASAGFPSTLPDGLRRLTVTDADPDQVERLVARIAWERCTGLRWVALEVAEGLGAAALDLGFLGALPRISGIVLRRVQHVGSRPSPVVAPFVGLPGGLARGSIELDGTSPDELAGSLRRHLGPWARVTVHASSARVGR